MQSTLPNESPCSATYDRVYRHGQYTWIVSIGTRDGTHVQSGIIVSDRWVMTNTLPQPQQLVVRIVDDRLEYTTASIRPITSIVPSPCHPRICLVGFEDPVPSSSYIAQLEWCVIPETIVSVGWNLFSDVDTTSVVVDLNELEIPTIEWDHEGEMYGGYPDCTPYTVHCNIDRGSPLVARCADGRSIVIGITDPVLSSNLIHTNQGRWIPVSILKPWLKSVVGAHSSTATCNRMKIQLVMVWAFVVLMFIVIGSIRR